MTSSKPNIVCLVQARMGSTRLPGKMMMKIYGEPLLAWVLKGISFSKKIDHIVLCTSLNPENDILEATAKKMDIGVFRGSEENVLERFMQAAEKFKADIVVRVCADNPLINGAVIDQAVDHLITANVDYSFNHIPKLGNGFPDGLGGEVFWRSTLERVFKEGVDQYSREHVTGYIWKNADNFKIGSFEAPSEIRYPDVKLDIDTPEDFKKLSSLIHYMKDRKRDLHDAATVCQAYKELG